MPYSAANDPLHWRECAEEMRTMAENLTDSGARETLLKVAAGYDDMANKATERVLWARPEKA